MLMNNQILNNTRPERTFIPTTPEVEEVTAYAPGVGFIFDWKSPHQYIEKRKFFNPTPGVQKISGFFVFFNISELDSE